MFDIIDDSLENIIENGDLFSDDYLLDNNNINFDDFSTISSDDSNIDLEDIFDINDLESINHFAIGNNHLIEDDKYLDNLHEVNISSDYQSDLLSFTGKYSDSEIRNMKADVADCEYIVSNLRSELHHHENMVSLSKGKNDYDDEVSQLNVAKSKYEDALSKLSNVRAKLNNAM